MSAGASDLLGGDALRGIKYSGVLRATINIELRGGVMVTVMQWQTDW